MKDYIISVAESVAIKGSIFFRSKYGLWFLGVVSFVESALPLPLVTDPFLAAFVLSDKLRLWKGVIVATIASALGGVAAYFLAAGFFEVLSRTVISEEALIEFVAIAETIQNSVFWLTLIGAFTPVPYTIVGMAAGFVQANIWLFILASVIGRGLRYTIVASLTYRYGERALAIARERILLASVVGLFLGLVYLALH